MGPEKFPCSRIIKWYPKSKGRLKVSKIIKNLFGSLEVNNPPKTIGTPIQIYFHSLRLFITRIENISQITVRIIIVMFWREMEFS